MRRSQTENAKVVKTFLVTYAFGELLYWWQTSGLFLGNLFSFVHKAAGLEHNNPGAAQRRHRGRAQILRIP